MQRKGLAFVLARFERGRLTLRRLFVQALAKIYRLCFGAFLINRFSKFGLGLNTLLIIHLQDGGGVVIGNAWNLCDLFRFRAKLIRVKIAFLSIIFLLCLFYHDGLVNNLIRSSATLLTVS